MPDAGSSQYTCRRSRPARRGRGARGEPARVLWRRERRRRGFPPDPARASERVSGRRTTSLDCSGWRSVTCNVPRRSVARQLTWRTRSPGAKGRMSANSIPSPRAGATCSEEWLCTQRRYQLAQALLAWERPQGHPGAEPIVSRHDAQWACRQSPPAARRRAPPNAVDRRRARSSRSASTPQSGPGPRRCTRRTARRARRARADRWPDGRSDRLRRARAGRARGARARGSQSLQCVEDRLELPGWEAGAPVRSSGNGRSGRTSSHSPSSSSCARWDRTFAAAAGLGRPVLGTRSRRAAGAGEREPPACSPG
jgi:hypothetical protein